MGKFTIICVFSLILGLSAVAIYAATQDWFQRALAEVPALQLAWLLGAVLIALLCIARFRNAR